MQLFCYTFPACLKHIFQTPHPQFVTQVFLLLFKGIMSRIFLKNNVNNHIKIIPLNHHLWPSRSVWWCLYLQRRCPLPVFSYLAELRTFLGVDLWAVVWSPEPITALNSWLQARVEGPTLNVAFTNSNQQILLVMPLRSPTLMTSPWHHQGCFLRLDKNWFKPTHDITQLL